MKWLKQNIFITFLLIWLLVIWILAYKFSIGNFEKENTISILDTLVQGTLTLLGVAIAVIIFRIQSLENRKETLEQSTLNYISQITGIVYPQWIPDVEDDIRKERLTDRYYYGRLERTDRPRGPEYLKALQDDRVAQQTRLMQTLSLHDNINKTIQLAKRDFKISSSVLSIPIIGGLVYLMIPSIYYSFFVVASMILLSSFGVILLILTVWESVK